MTESVAMLEIRKIKTVNSLRYREMSPEELTKEFDESTKRFIERMGREIKIVTLPTPQIKH
jgi:AAA+ ATPase superfamily predicted ATPase